MHSTTFRPRTKYTRSIFDVNELGNVISKSKGESLVPIFNRVLEELEAEAFSIITHAEIGGPSEDPFIRFYMENDTQFATLKLHHDTDILYLYGCVELTPNQLYEVSYQPLSAEDLAKYLCDLQVHTKGRFTRKTIVHVPFHQPWQETCSYVVRAELQDGFLHLDYSPCGENVIPKILPAQSNNYFETSAEAIQHLVIDYGEAYTNIIVNNQSSSENKL